MQKILEAITDAIQTAEGDELVNLGHAWVSVFRLVRMGL